MNFWGFHPNIFPLLAQEFEKFVQENKESTTAEFYLPGFVDMLLHR